MYSERLVQVLNEVAHDFRGQLLASIKNVLNEPRLRNTGAGGASVKVDVVPGNSTTSPALVVTLDDYVLLLDKSKMQWTKLPNIRKLVEWARTKKSDEREVQRLAWSKAWDLKKNDSWKPKKWRKRALSEVLKDMNAKMVAAFEAAIDADVQVAIDAGLK